MKNVILLISIAIIFICFFNYYLYHVIKKLVFLNRLKTFSIYFLSSIIVFIFLDFYVFKLFGHGFPSSVSEEKFERSPTPYDMFSGKPNYKDHNSLGFRGDEFKNIDRDTFQIAFFGGSTGYNGDPTIAKLIEQKLREKNIKVQTFNFSSVSSNHNQHLHRLLKYSELRFDLVIFYGGFNETLQTYLYDPRPGYPFNYWIRDELDKFKYILLKYSSIYAEYEKQTGKLSGLSKIKKNINYKSDEWINNLLKNYEKTLIKSKNLTNNFIESNLCKKPSFLAFYQPISLNRSDDFSKKIIKQTKNFFKERENLIDISSSLDERNFIDSVHITQSAKNHISDIILEYILNDTLKKCF